MTFTAAKMKVWHDMKFRILYILLRLLSRTFANIIPMFGILALIKCET